MQVWKASPGSGSYTALPPGAPCKSCTPHRRLSCFALQGGGMIFTFYKARGLNVGSSLVEEDKLALAKELEEKAKVGLGELKQGG